MYVCSADFNSIGIGVGSSCVMIISVILDQDSDMRPYARQIIISLWHLSGTGGGGRGTVF